MHKFIYADDNFFPHNGVARVPVELPIGTYVVDPGTDKIPMSLRPVGNIAVPDRIYGERHEPRIMKTANHRAEQGLPTTVWLDGEKGSGKTMLACSLASEGRGLGMPTIMITCPLSGDSFNVLMSQIPRSVVVFDEFDKNYRSGDMNSRSGPSEQDQLLGLLSGATGIQHLFVLTTNDSHAVSTFMRNRPGRVRYYIPFMGVSEAIVKEYMSEHLVDKSKLDELVSLLGQVHQCNFDILQGVVDECNLHPELSVQDTMALLNVERAPTVWDCTFTGYIDHRHGDGAARRDYNDVLVTASCEVRGTAYQIRSNRDLCLSLRNYAPALPNGGDTKLTPAQVEHLRGMCWSLRFDGTEAEYQDDGSLRIAVCESDKDGKGHVVLRRRFGDPKFSKYNHQF